MHATRRPTGSGAGLSLIAAMVAWAAGSGAAQEPTPPQAEAGVNAPEPKGEPAPARKAAGPRRSRGRNGGRAPVDPEALPVCTHRHDVPTNPAAAQPAPPMIPVPPGMPPQMAEMFQRMNRAMSANPAMGFQTFVDDLSRMEGQALRDVRLTVQEERTIGREGLRQFLTAADQQGHREVVDEAKLKYLRDLTQQMAAHMKNGDRYPDLEVHLVDAPEPDGQCFPGGFLVFTTGLLEQPDEATVAGVVAHELAHLDLGHVYQYAKRTRLAESTFQRSQADFGQFFTRGMTMFGLMMSPFRPEHESAADCAAATWLYQEGYDPMALVRFFERLADRNQEARFRDFSMFSLGRSHPYSLDRRREVLERLEQLQGWRPKALELYPDNLRALRARGPLPR